MDPRHDWKKNKKNNNLEVLSTCCAFMPFNPRINDEPHSIRVCPRCVRGLHGGGGQTLIDRGRKAERDCAPSHRRSAPTVAALSPRSHTRTWRNSSTSSHSLRRPHPRRPHLHRRSRRRCLRRHHHHHPLRLRYRDDPGGWRSCRRACRRSLGARWRCRWTRWSASSACPPWCAWPTVRLGPFSFGIPTSSSTRQTFHTPRMALCESPAKPFRFMSPQLCQPNLDFNS